MAGMQGTVGYADKLKCTSCGEENMRGWWPT